MDPITDMLNRLKNAQAVKKPTVDVPFSKLKFEIAKILKQHGFVEEVERKRRANLKIIRLYLKNDPPGILGAKRISKPGQRIYKGYKELKPVKQGYGIAIISTSQGLMSNIEAKKRKLGGEVLCEVW